MRTFQRQRLGAIGGVAVALAMIGAMPSRAYADTARDLPVPATLFTPAPLGTLSPMVTDRPGQTNGPYTVAPGHLQIETGMVNYTYDHGTSLHRFDLFSQTEFRVGIVPNAEFDVAINPYSWQRQGDVRSSGVGDTTLQGKWTIWSDAAATTAFGAIPFVTLPTSQHGLGVSGTEGGVSFPFAAALPAGFGLGVMPGIAAARNNSGNGYHTQITASVSLQHQIVGNLSAFGEFASSIDASHSHDWVGTIDFGLVYLLTDNFQIDLGMNVGVTHAAPDLNPFLGLSVRF